MKDFDSIRDNIMGSIENRVRQAYNQGYEDGRKQEPCEDATSRQAIIERLKKEDKILYTTTGLNYLIRAIEEIPSVKPQEPKTGHWIEEKIYPPLSDAQITIYRCSCCDLHFDCVSNYCPNCGAKMEESEEEQ